MFGLRSLSALSLDAVLLCCAGAIGPACAQTIGTLEHDSDTLRGTVVNSLTREPVGRALVYSPDTRYATMTDDRGRFEFRFAPAEGQRAAGVRGTSNVPSADFYPHENAATSRRIR